MMIRILQIKDIENTDYAFRDYAPSKFKFGDYEVEYCLETDSFENKTDEEILEVVFHIFNMRIPKDFEGHSISVSDLIAIESDGRDRLYYCDSFGWKLLWNKEVRA